jgi:hypothetical protein
MVMPLPSRMAGGIGSAEGAVGNAHRAFFLLQAFTKNGLQPDSQLAPGAGRRGASVSPCCVRFPGRGRG